MANVFDENGKIIRTIEIKPELCERIRRRSVGYINEPKARSKCRSKRLDGLINSMANLKLSTNDDVYMEFHHAETNVIKYRCTNPLLLLRRMSGNNIVHGTSQSFHIPSSSSNPVSYSTALNLPTPLTSQPLILPTLLSYPSTCSLPTPLSTPTFSTSHPPVSLPSIDFEMPLENLQCTPSKIPKTAFDKEIDDLLLQISPSVSSIKNNNLNPNTCQICKGIHDTDTDLDSPWIGCSHKPDKCNWWAHTVCLGWKFHKGNVNGEDKFWCPTHRQPYVQNSRKKLFK